MKKLTAFLLAMLFTCGTMISCDKDAPHEASNSNETTQSEPSAPTDDVSKDYDQDDSQQGFTIYGKKYYYKGNSFNDQYTGYSQGDVLLLTVTNETEIHYKARVKITYLDENGEKIKTQSRAFNQYMAGYTNYFLFQPGSEYASYTLDLTLTELNEEEKAALLVDKLTYTFEGLREKIMPDAEKAFAEGVMVNIPTILGKVRMTFSEEVPRKYVNGLLVLFDNTGEIYLISNCGRPTHAAGGFQKEWTQDPFIYFEREHRAKAEWPEELKGELTALIFPTSVENIKEPQLPQ